MTHTLILLLLVHFLADYPLQGDFLAKAKNRFAPIPGVPWYQAMFAHSAIHAGGVYLVTGSWVIALGELIAHFSIDDIKCQGGLSFNGDQAVHVTCKFFWALCAGGVACI